MLFFVDIAKEVVNVPPSLSLVEEMAVEPREKTLLSPSVCSRKHSPKREETVAGSGLLSNLNRRRSGPTADFQYRKAARPPLRDASLTLSRKGLA